MYLYKIQLHTGKNLGSKWLGTCCWREIFLTDISRIKPDIFRSVSGHANTYTLHSR